VEWSRKSIDIAARVGGRQGQQAVAQALYLQGAALYRLARFDEAVAACRESLSTYEAIGELLGQARAYNNLAIVYSDLGRWEESTEAYNESLAINKLIGNIQEQGFVANNLGNIHLYRGDFEHASQLFSKQRHLKRIGAPCRKRSP
jgi:tetratricopeptide (TPR) repeat protein